MKMISLKAANHIKSKGGSFDPYMQRINVNINSSVGGKMGEDNTLSANDGTLAGSQLPPTDV